MSKIIGIVALTGMEGLIAIDDKLPLKSKTDMEFFKSKTKGNVVVMGRKTFETLGNKPLKDRFNVVLTKQKLETPYKEVHYTDSYRKVLQMIDHNNPKDIYIIGGSQVYRDLIPICDEVYVTLLTPSEYHKVDMYADVDAEQTWFPFSVFRGSEDFANYPSLDIWFPEWEIIKTFYEDDHHGQIYKFTRDLN